MGLLVNSVFSFKNGLDLSNIYLTFDNGSTSPTPINMNCTIDAEGVRTYTANAMLYIFSSRQAKLDGFGFYRPSNPHHTFATSSSWSVS